MDNVEVKKEIKMEVDSFQPTVSTVADSQPVDSFQSVTHAQLVAHSQLVAQSKPGTPMLFMSQSGSGSGSRSGSKAQAQPQMIILQAVPYSQLVANSKTLVKLDSVIQPLAVGDSQPISNLVPRASQKSPDSKPVICQLSGTGLEPDSKPVISLSGTSQNAPDFKPVVSLMSEARQEAQGSNPVVSISGTSQNPPDFKPVVSFLSGTGQEPDAKPVISLSGPGQNAPDFQPMVSFLSGPSEKAPDFKPVVSFLSGPSEKAPDFKPVVSFLSGTIEKAPAFQPVVSFLSGTSENAPDFKPVVFFLSGAEQEPGNSKPVVNVMSGTGQEMPDSNPVNSLVARPKQAKRWKGRKLPKTSQSQTVSGLQTGSQTSTVSGLQTGSQTSTVSGLQTGSQTSTVSGLQTGSQTSTVSGLQTGSQTSSVSGLQTGSQTSTVSGLQTGSQHTQTQCIETGSQTVPVLRFQTGTQTEHSVSGLRSRSKTVPVLCVQAGTQTLPLAHLQTKTHAQVVQSSQDTTKTQPELGVINVASQTRPGPKPRLKLQSDTSPTVQPVSLVQRFPHYQVYKSSENLQDIQVVFSKNPTQTSALKVQTEKKTNDVTNDQDEVESKAELRKMLGLKEPGLEAESDSKAEVRKKNCLKDSGAKEDSSRDMNDEGSRLNFTETAEGVKVEAKSECEMEEELSEYESIDEDFVVFKDDLDEEEEEEEEDSRSNKRKRKSKKYTTKEFVTFRYDSDDDEEKQRSKNSDEDYQPSVSEADSDESRDSDSDCDSLLNSKMDEMDELEPEVVLTPDGDYSCTYCVQVCSTREEAEAHILTHYEYPCETCDEKCLTIRHLNYHKRTNHKRPPPYNLLFLCMVSGCENMSVSKDSLLKHIDSAHGSGTSLTCSWCSKSSRTAVQFKSHIQNAHLASHRGSCSTDYLCESCGVEMANPTAYTQHLKNCDGVRSKPHSLCQYCGLLVSRYHSHVEVHTKRTIPCKFDSCKLKFKTKYHMQKHYQHVHLGFRKWHCTYEGCSFSANSKNNLKGHVDMLHLKIRGFPCTWPDCDKSFFQKKHLSVHLRIHQDIRYLTCDLCDYSCRQRAALNWHMNKKHDMGPKSVTKKKKAGSSKLKDQMSEQNIPPVGVPAPWHHQKRGRKARGKKSKRKNKD